MKIAIASTTSTIEGEISEKGGRAPYYLIFDEKNELTESIKNPFAVGGGGAGFGVAKMLADKNIKKVMVGKVGDNMKGALQKFDIELLEEEGLIKDILTTL